MSPDGGDPPSEPSDPPSDPPPDPRPPAFAALERPPLLQRIAPVTAHLRRYRSTSLRHDALAGLTVAALAIPASMGFAEVAGVAPVAGLYALLLPVLAYAAVGSSRQLVVGPEATSAALVATGLAPLTDGDPARYLQLASMLALLVGAGFLLARLVRLGWIADYLSRAALVGFIHGIVVILVCGQLGKLTGVPIAADKPIGQVVDLVGHLDAASVATVATGAATLVVLFGLKAVAPKAPAPLFAVVGAIVVSGAASLADHGVATIGTIPSGLPSLVLPRVGLADTVHLVPVALGIVFAVYASTILTARAIAGRHGEHVVANQELLALGLANLGAGVSQAFPIGNSNSRTAVNDQMGVATQVSGLFAALGVAAVLLVLTGPMSNLPAAALGAVIVYAAVGMVSLADWRGLRAVSHGDVVIAAAAFVGVVVVGVLQGILVAVILSVVDVVRRSARPHDAVLGWVPRMRRFADVSLHPSARRPPGVVIYRLDDRLFFANANYVQGRIREAVASAAPVEWFVLDAEGLVGVDSSGTEALRAVHGELRTAGIGFAVARLKAPVLERFEAAGLVALLGADHFHPTVHEAVEAVAPGWADADQDGRR